MNVLQVKQFNELATKTYLAHMDEWRTNKREHQPYYPMYVFQRFDKHGNLINWKKGWVAFDKQHSRTSAMYGKNKQEAINRFEGMNS